MQKSDLGTQIIWITPKYKQLSKCNSDFLIKYTSDITSSGKYSLIVKKNKIKKSLLIIQNCEKASFAFRFVWVKRLTSPLGLDVYVGVKLQKASQQNETQIKTEQNFSIHFVDNVRRIVPRATK